MRVVYRNHILGAVREVLVSSLGALLLKLSLPTYSQGFILDTLFIFILVRTLVATMAVFDALLNQVLVFGPKRVLRNAGFYRNLRANFNPLTPRRPGLRFGHSMVLYAVFVSVLFGLSVLSFGSGTFRWYIAAGLFWTMIIFGRFVMHNSTPMVLFLGVSGEDTTFGLMIAKRTIRTRHFASLLRFDDQGTKGFIGHGSFGNIRSKEEEDWKGVFERAVNDAKLVIVHVGEQASDELEYEMSVINRSRSLSSKTIFFNIDSLKGVPWRLFGWRLFHQREADAIQDVRRYLTQAN